MIGREAGPIRRLSLTNMNRTMNNADSFARVAANTVSARSVAAPAPARAAAGPVAGLVVAAWLLAAPALAHAGAAEKFANAIPSCPWADKLVPGTPSKLPENFKMRAVQLPSGSAQVSVVEGFRFPAIPEGKTEPFANVKIELSEPDKFVADRETIISNIRWIHSTSKDMEAPQPLLVDLNGFEGPMINRASFSGTTLALIALFNEKEKVVVTIYLENAPPEQRGFQTKDEWNGMRDRFLVALTSCGAKALDASGSRAAASPAASTAAVAGPVATPAASPSPTSSEATVQPVPLAAPPLPVPIIVAPPKP